MTLTEVAAFIGAAAWIYPIFIYLNKKCTKPSIKIIPAEKAEIGYTTFGPIFNLQCAISTEKKEAIIERIITEVNHENGEMHTLVWKFLDEIHFEIKSFTGESGTISKNQPAIALKVSPTSLAEKVIGFQDNEFKTKFNELSNKLIDQESHLKRTGSNDLANKLFITKEFTDLNNFYSNGMFWREGKYIIKLKTYISSSKDPYVSTFEMTLSQNNTEQLKKNTSFLKDALKPFIEPIDEKKIPGSPLWNWVNPIVKKI